MYKYEPMSQNQALIKKKKAHKILMWKTCLVIIFKRHWLYKSSFLLTYINKKIALCRYTCINNSLFPELLLQVPLQQKTFAFETFGLVGHKASQQASWLTHLAAREKQLDREGDPKHTLFLQKDPYQTAVSHVKGIKNP